MLVETAVAVKDGLPSRIARVLRMLSGGEVSLSSNLTGKWLMSLFRCCCAPMIMRSVLSKASIHDDTVIIPVGLWDSRSIRRMQNQVAESATTLHGKNNIKQLFLTLFYLFRPTPRFHSEAPPGAYLLL